MSTSKPLSILVVEDSLADYRLVKEMLEECAGDNFVLHHAEQVSTAVPLLESAGVDIIILDLGLPDGNGLDTLVKVHALTPDTPIVVLSQVEDEAMAVKAVRMGAQDFLVKGHISGALLNRSLRYALERRQLEEHLHRLAHHDALTGLPNRKLFYDRLARAVAAARRHERPLALMLLDLNEFKQVNDTWGHQVGDELLRQVADRLSRCLRSTDCVARLGGDEFILYVSDLGDIQDTARIAAKLIESMGEPCVIGGNPYTIRCSLGIALHPEDGDDIEVLVREADAAMYAAKAASGGGSSYRFYSRELDAAAAKRRELEESLRRALAAGEFVVNYQPQIDLHSRRVVGMEALMRWHPTGGEIVQPGEFMSALEESGLIVDVGAWVLETACRQAENWRRDHSMSLKIAVNISPRQFRDPHLVARVTDALKVSGLEPGQLELELAESSLRDDETLALDVLRRLNALGVRIALDNYRGRAMSLRDLKGFPIHSIKLDRSIVRDMADNPEDAAIVQAVISVAHVFRMKGVAEGVETQGQVDLLRSHACDDAQGFAFSRPLSAEAFDELLCRSPGGAYMH